MFLFSFVSNALEKLRLLSYFQGIKYLMNNKYNFIFKFKRSIRLWNPRIVKHYHKMSYHLIILN